jgi:hypothetical protein
MLYMSLNTGAPPRWLQVVAQTGSTVNQTLVQLVGNEYVHV